MSANDTEFICARCAKTSKTCCQKAQVFITKGDVRRVAEATGRTDFHESAPASDPDYAANAELDPVWSRIYGPDGRRRILAHKPDGDCVFLTPTGCTLSEDVRPSVCLLYPFDYTDSGIKGLDAPYCPEPERHNLPLLLTLLGMSREKAEAWRERLYREIVEEFPGER